MDKHEQSWPPNVSDASSERREYMRDDIVRRYDEESAARARNARLKTQEVINKYEVNSLNAKLRAEQREVLERRRREQEVIRAAERRAQRDLEQAQARSDAAGADILMAEQRKERVAVPLSSKESHERTTLSREGYERARQDRDFLSPTRTARTSNRELIDGRGSVDSRAFNEFNELVGYTIDGRDRHDPMVDTTISPSRWASRAGQDTYLHPGITQHLPSSQNMHRRRSDRDIGSLSDTISGRRNYTAPKSGYAALPGFVKIAIPLLVVLIIILVAIFCL